MRYVRCVSIYGTLLGTDSWGIDRGVLYPKSFDQLFYVENVLSLYLVYDTLFHKLIAGLGDVC